MKPFCTKLFAAFLFLVLLFNGSKLRAQSYAYIPFPDSNFIWKCYTYCGAHNVSYYDYRTYNITSDTIINNIMYHQISSSMFIREDSSKRVYFINTASPPENLLYDFSLSVGDTMYSGQYTCRIDSVDTLSYYGKERRTLYSHTTSHNDIWIEGIGSHVGPLGLRTVDNGFCHASVLCEASENSIIMFQRNDAPCSYYNSISDPAPSPSFSLFPNPATDAITITTQDGNTSSFDIDIYDVAGNCLLTRKNISSNPNNISVSLLRPGYYLLKLTGNRDSIAPSDGISLCKGFIIAR